MCIIIYNDLFNITTANRLVKTQFILNFKSGSKQSAASVGFEVKVTASEHNSNTWCDTEWSTILVVGVALFKTHLMYLTANTCEVATTAKALTGLKKKSHLSSTPTVAFGLT